MDIFLFPQIRVKVLRYSQYFASISMLNTILDSSKFSQFLKVTLIALIILLELNNYVRGKFLINKNMLMYYISYMISIIIIGYFTGTMTCFGVPLYNVLLIIEVIVRNRNINILIMVFTFIVYVISYLPYINLNKLNDVEQIFLNYFGPLFIACLFRSIMVEKVRITNLNEELKEANLNLKRLSNRIEELTIEKERTRIAQELHDSMGHSLVALKMNLEYAENVVDLKPEKTKEVINKAQGITKDCIINLRKVVTLLKEERNVEKLRQAIIELCEDFGEENGIKLILDMEEKIEELPPDIKNCIYKTIREAITNGVKHGKAKLFNIEILQGKQNITFKIKNNGDRCYSITKSNGLKGIEDRIVALGGKVKFTSEESYGFVIEAAIPNL